jgi:hypothetical protein
VFFDRIKEGYVDEQPLHIADPQSSVFDIISFTDFETLSTTQIQDRLRSKNIVVTGCPGPTVEFDKAGLRTLSPFDRIISIQGMNSDFQI